MLDPDHLRPANPEDIADSLARALLYERTQRVHPADRVKMARDEAECLAACGFVVMKRAGAEAPSTSNMPSPQGR